MTDWKRIRPEEAAGKTVRGINVLGYTGFDRLTVSFTDMTYVEYQSEANQRANMAPTSKIKEREQ